MIPCLRDFWDIHGDLRIFDGVVLLHDRIVIPPNLRQYIICNLHSAHQGVSGMLARAQTIVFWPGILSDLNSTRELCRLCNKNAPSQSKQPPIAPTMPTTPFQLIFADYFQLHAKHFLVAGDRFSGWTEVIKVRCNAASSGSKGLCETLRNLMATFGVPEEITSDGGPEFISQETADFFKKWGIRHRLSSAYFPQSNGRAEVAVKATKRMLEENTGQDGSLNTDNVVRALLQKRNTPDRDCLLSPAEILFGRSLNDSLPQISKNVPLFDNQQVHGHWHAA